MTSQIGKPLTPARIKAILRHIDRHKAAIGKHRDELREIIEEISSIGDDADEATELLDQATDALSRLL